MAKRKRKAIVAVVGRPNVGKSTLFNVLAGRRISIVEDTPGVTRDRIYADCSWLDKEFTLIDTGGIEPDSKDIILSQMREQAQLAIDMADVILFMVDRSTGMVDSDNKVADMLRRSGKPVVLVVNKVDSPTKMMADIYEFYNLGIGDPWPISGANRTGIGDMLDEVIKYFPDDSADEEEDDAVRIAIVGKPNVGKSSIINRLIGHNRVIVSDVAGTTRDAIDTRIAYHGREYVFIDTAGIRRRNKIKENLEHYMIARSVGAVERADITVLVIDVEDTLNLMARTAKAGMRTDELNSIAEDFIRSQGAVPSFLNYAELIFISAETGQRLVKLYDMIDMVHDNQNLRIQTGVLNEIINEACIMQQPPSDKGKSLRIYYGTQAGVCPPTFVLFVNDKKLMHFSYQRYIENRIRDAFGFRGTPIRFVIRERTEKK